MITPPKAVKISTSYNSQWNEPIITVIDEDGRIWLGHSENEQINFNIKRVKFKPGYMNI